MQNRKYISFLLALLFLIFNLLNPHKHFHNEDIEESYFHSHLISHDDHHDNPEDGEIEFGYEPENGFKEAHGHSIEFISLSDKMILKIQKLILSVSQIREISLSNIPFHNTSKIQVLSVRIINPDIILTSSDTSPPVS